MSRCGIALATALVVTAAMAQASAAEFGDARRGAETAVRLCGTCHALPDAAQTSVADAAPPFIALAERPDLTETTLLTILSAPHGPMPVDALTRQDRADVIAYLLSLKKS
jgi:mono/diheme cytochrome c family protein